MTTSSAKLALSVWSDYGCRYVPAFSSILALLRLSMISVIDLIDPFLYTLSDRLCGLWLLTARLVTYILKLPPMKNRRPMLAADVIDLD